MCYLEVLLPCASMNYCMLFGSYTFVAQAAECGGVFGVDNKPSVSESVYMVDYEDYSRFTQMFTIDLPRLH